VGKQCDPVVLKRLSEIVDIVYKGVDAYGIGV
jgi:hypothetical protein